MTQKQLVMAQSLLEPWISRPMPYKKHVFICTNHRPDNPQSGCASRGGVELQLECKQRLKTLGLSDSIRVNKAGCLGVCEQGAAMVIYPQQIWYGAVSKDDLDEIIEVSILNDGVVSRLTI